MPGDIPGAYYKDTENEFNKFVGIWKFQEGEKIFEVVFQKKEMFYNVEGNYLEDILIGEYKYAESSNEKVNTLDNLIMEKNNIFEYNIVVTIILDYHKPMAERRLLFSFKDPQRDYLFYRIIVKHFTGSQPGQLGMPEHIEVKFQGDSSILPSEDSPTELRFPERDYILYKQ